MLNLHLTIEGASFGGVGPSLSPKGVLSAGLKIDADALPRDLLEKLSKGKVDLDDPAVTLELLKLNAVIGVTGFFTSSGTLRSVGSNARFVTLRSTTPTPRCVPVRFSRTPARAVWATASTVGPIAISTSGKSCLSPPISARLPACWASARTR